MTTDIDLDALRAQTDPLIANLTETVQQVKDHDHPTRGDLYCLNLTSYMGDRMATVLRRLAAEHAEVDRLRPIAEAARYEYGAQPCIEGDCDHAGEADDNAAEDAPCPLVETRYATAAELLAVLSLLVSTDGVPLNDDEEIPVGEIRRMLAEAAAR